MHPTGVDVARLVALDDVIKLVNQYQDYTQVPPRVEMGPRTSCHTSCNHLIYNLTCTQFEQLHVAAGHACQRCRADDQPLYIDHDHEIGMWGVRGLVCPSCNSHLGRVDNGLSPMDELTFQYLLRPYPYRQPPAYRPRWPLSTVAVRAYRVEIDRAGRAAGFGPLRMGRQVSAWYPWRAKWEQQPGVVHLMHLIEGRYDFVTPSAAVRHERPR